MNEPFDVILNGIDGYKFVMKIPVQFRDVDAMRHMNNVAYFAFLETARMEYFTYVLQLTEQHDNILSAPFILGGQSISYRTPAFLGEKLLVGVRTNWVRNKSFGFEYEMRAGTDGRLIAEGNGTHVMFDYEAGQTIPMPDDWLARMEEFEGRKLRQ